MKRKCDYIAPILEMSLPKKRGKYNYQDTHHITNISFSKIPDYQHQKIKFKIKNLSKTKALETIVNPMLNCFTNEVSMRPDYNFRYYSYTKFSLEFKDTNIAKQFLLWFNNISTEKHEFKKYIKSANSCYNNLVIEQSIKQKQLEKKSQLYFKKYMKENTELRNLQAMKNDIYLNRFKLIQNKYLVCFQFNDYLNINKSVIDTIFKTYDYYLLNYNLLYVLVPQSIKLNYHNLFINFNSIHKPFIDYYILHPNDKQFLDFFLKRHYRENK